MCDTADGPCMSKQDEKTTDGDGSDGSDGSYGGGVVSRMPVDTVSEYYNMEHGRRGLLYIFAHEKYDSKETKPRKGTEKDVRDIVECFESLGFEVHKFLDLTRDDIQGHIDRAAADDHTECDCLAIFILSHGDHDLIWAKDKTYMPEEEIYNKFTADKCPSLAGKPKLFFIQTCQGKNLDAGVKLVGTLHTQFDGRLYYTLPIQADFLIAYASYRNYKAIRSPIEGSYFVKFLCQELLDRAHKKEDLLSILTTVNRKVSIEVKSNAREEKDSNKKQAPYFRSSLTRKLIFTSK